MNDYLIYLSLPPYLAQWYANECTQIHNRDKVVCPREIYRFPTKAVPVRGSQESDVINMHLAKQPAAVRTGALGRNHPLPLQIGVV